MATIGSNHHPRKAGWLLIALFVLLAAAGALLWFQLSAPPHRPFAVPGSQDSSPFAATVPPEEIEKIETRLRANLMSGVGLVSWYQQANEELSTPAQWSGEWIAQDQLLYGFWLAEQDRKSLFDQWHETFRTYFLSPRGLVYPVRTRVMNDPQAGFSGEDSSARLEPVAGDGDSWPDSLLYLKVLALAYAKWPSEKLDEQETGLAASLSLVIGSSLAPDQLVAIPTSAPTQDPAATPTPQPEPASELATEGYAEDPVIRLAALDLLALKTLAELDPGFENRFTDAVSLVQGGLISDALPLYAYGYATSQQGYVRFIRSAPVVDLPESLASALHLAEIGQLDPRTQSWLLEHVLNDAVLYSTYHIAQGQPSTNDESLAGLALTARIARITGHETLYRRAVERLSWHRATSPTSSVLDAIFRLDSQGVVTMTARDNILALLAMS
ncbi:MAG: hypothetical protein EOM70_03245 [Clostridia bacterium]|nr:hypothetical protein [Clostridia bacterium]